jgi:hypothetical protein
MLHEYETQFINGVNRTYEMLKELDEVTNDEDFWKVFGEIKTGFHVLDDAATKYYAEMRLDGIERPYENCSLTYEILHGTQGLYDKYLAILDKIAEVSAGS